MDKERERERLNEEEGPKATGSGEKNLKKKDKHTRWGVGETLQNGGDCNQNVGLFRTPHGHLKLSRRTNKLN